MKITMRDVANSANVSIATVSRALSGKGFVSQATYELVLSVCKKLGYPSRGRPLRLNGDSNLIAIVSADLHNEFNLYIIDGVTRIAQQYGYEIVIFDQKEDPSKGLQVIEPLSKLNLSGIILTPVRDVTSLGINYISALEKLNVPIILVDRDLEYSRFGGVFLDNVQGSYSAVKVLIKEGHKKIATICGAKTSLTGRERFVGFQKALKEYKIDMYDKYVREGNFTVEGGYQAAIELLDLDVPPSALFIANSVMMKGVAQAVLERNIKIPNELSMISFDDLVDKQLIHNLSVVEQPMEEMGERAMEMLHTRIIDPTGIPRDTIRLILNPKLLLRGSEKK